jgi:TolB protein
MGGLACAAGSVMTFLALGITGVFMALGLLHVYWALGGGRGKLSAVPEISGRPAFRPSASATISVAVALFAAAFIVAASAGWVHIPISKRVLSVPMFGMAFVFFARAVGEFRLIGFFKRVRGTAFARRDSFLYSPLCLLLAAAVFILALASNGVAFAASGATAVQFIGAPTLVAPGMVSSEFSEIRATVSPDGRFMLWGSTNRPGGPKGWNIWRSRHIANSWSAPEAVSFNSEANDFDPAFSPDGHWVYFFSNREGGLGGDDIYRVAVDGDQFGAPEHLGPEVNTAKDEWAPSISPDGQTLLFATDGRGGAGRHDLFTSQRVNSAWTEAKPLPGALNTAADEFDATFLSDGRTIVFSRSPNVEGDDPIILNVAGRGASGYEKGAPLPFSNRFQFALGPTIDWHEREVLYFSAAPRDAKAARPDIYAIRYRL